MLKTILFDLDGTLLPMDLDRFTQCYFKYLIAYVSPLGYDPKAVYRAVMYGVEKMVHNDGSCTNEKAFWRGFAEVLGEDACRHRPEFDRYYVTDFAKAKEVCGFQPKVAEILSKIKGEGICLAAATNPLFPMTAQIARLEWAGADPKDFAHITAYENSCYAKPNPKYYQEMLEQLGCKAEETLMVGNDVTDDMAAANAGLQVFLLTDCLINKEQKDIFEYPHGNYDDLWAFIQKNK